MYFKVSLLTSYQDKIFLLRITSCVISYVSTVSTWHCSFSCAKCDTCDAHWLRIFRLSFKLRRKGSIINVATLPRNLNNFRWYTTSKMINHFQLNTVIKIESHNTFPVKLKGNTPRCKLVLWLTRSEPINWSGVHLIVQTKSIVERSSASFIF